MSVNAVTQVESETGIHWSESDFIRMQEHGVFDSCPVTWIDGTIYVHSPGAAADSLQPWRWTRESYHKMARSGVLEGRRVELLAGEVIPMSPKGWLHTVATRKTAEELERVFEDAGIGWVSRQEPFVVDDHEPEPDLSVLPGRFEDYTDVPTVSLLIVEIADSSLRKDTKMKLEHYAAGGVLDYWVVDVEHLILLVFRDPYSLPDGTSGYSTQLKLTATDTISPLAAPNAAIRVADLLP